MICWNVSLFVSGQHGTMLFPSLSWLASGQLRIISFLKSLSRVISGQLWTRLLVRRVINEWSKTVFVCLKTTWDILFNWLNFWLLQCASSVLGHFWTQYLFDWYLSLPFVSWLYVSQSISGHISLPIYLQMVLHSFLAFVNAIEHINFLNYDWLYSKHPEAF